MSHVPALTLQNIQQSKALCVTQGALRARLSNALGLNLPDNHGQIFYTHPPIVAESTQCAQDCT